MGRQVIEVVGHHRPDPERRSLVGTHRFLERRDTYQESGASQPVLTSGARPRLGRVVIDLSGKRGGQAGREQCVAGNRLDQLSRQGRLAPGDPSPAVNFNELGMRAWPHKGQSVVARCASRPLRESSLTAPIVSDSSPA